MSNKKHIIVLTEKQLQWLRLNPMGSYKMDIEECNLGAKEIKMFEAVEKQLLETKEI